MALVADGYALTVNLVDTSGSVSTLSYDLTAGVIADALTESGTIVAALADVTNSTISGYRVSSVFTEDAFTLPANAENAIKAEVSAFIDGEGTKKAIFRIPAPVIGIFVSGSGAGYNIVDTGDTDLLAYAAIFATGGQAFISDGETLVAPVSNALSAGRRISVRSRNP